MESREQLEFCCVFRQGRVEYAFLIIQFVLFNICRNEDWNSCPLGYVLSGLYRSDGKNLGNIEYARCCKPTGAPNSFKSCYKEDVWDRFDWYQKGMVSCRKDSHYISGLFRSVCGFLYCIEEFQCCQFQLPEG